MSMIITNLHDSSTQILQNVIILPKSAHKCTFCSKNYELVLDNDCHKNINAFNITLNITECELNSHLYDNL